MIRWLRQYLAIARNAFVVCLSDPVFLVLMLLVLALMAVFACLPSYNFGEELRLVRDQSMALTFLGGCTVAAIGAATVIVRDVRQGAVSVLMSRPVSSLSYVLGKWTGIAGALTVYHLTVSLACLWVSRIGAGSHARHQELDLVALGIYAGVIVLALLAMALKHYFFGGWYVWQASLAVAVAFALGFLVMNCVPPEDLSGFGAGIDWRSAQGCLMLFFAELVFSAVLVPIAIAFDMVALLAAGCVLFFAGLLSETVLNALPLAAGGWAQAVVKAVVPNWQIFWSADFLANQSGSLAPSYVVACVVHAFLYALVCLVIGTLVFNRREFAGHDVV